MDKTKNIDYEPEAKKAKLDEGVNESESATIQEKVLTEKDVGISEYISALDGYTGIIKQRYSDFLVNEVDQNGDVVRLTDTAVPQPQESSKKNENQDALSEEWMQKLKDLENSTDKSAFVEIEVGDNKELRGRMHQAIREGFEGMDSKTVEKDGSKYIKVYKVDKKNAGQQRRWNHKEGDFCHCVLYKENKDTNEAINIISKMIRMKPGAFTFAGTKDRRAKTCQWLSVYRVDAARLQSMNKGLRNMALGNFKYMKNTLKLGDLEGNHFTIVLRKVSATKELIDESMESLKENGFINYFGMQRFGTTSIPTHLVGRAMLQFKFDEAIELILKPREGDHQDVHAARQCWADTQDASAALKLLGRRPCIERHLLVGLEKCAKNDFVGALSSIPRNTRLMYIHAYQSFVWNTLVSRRKAKFGLKPMVGDLVLQECDRANGDKQKVNVLKEEDLDKYTMYDIVMPLPGHDVTYPENEIAFWYQDMLKADGLEGGLKSSVRDYSLPGSYRKIASKPSRMKWEVCRYDDTTLPLVLSDYERLKGEKEPERQTEGEHQAVIVEFSLSSSTYATMALREVLKCDTSAAHMTSLSS